MRGAAAVALLLAVGGALAWAVSGHGRATLRRVGLLPPRHEMAWYREHVEALRRTEVPSDPRCVVLVGNSLTALFPREIAAARGWVRRGISGDRTADIASRLESTVLDIPCDPVVLVAGSNDVVHDGAGPEDVRRGIAALAERLRDGGRHPIVGTPPPTRGPHAHATGTLAATAESLRRWARAESLPVLDLHRVLANPQGELGAPYSADGLHLTRAGYRVWAQALEEVLERRSPERRSGADGVGPGQGPAR